MILHDNLSEEDYNLSSVAITVSGVSKRFRLYDTPVQRMKEALHPLRKKYHRDFWALKNISFEIRKGEIVGLIGRNGSGKSTLLHIITGTLTPTAGDVTVHGRISALLELGAGFNPELTGKENVYMNGAIEGFSRNEMDEKFQDITAFAEIGDFIDQPVKSYSSGMFVRLAFAVAVNIDPEILIIDEALSVGDVRFSHKCMRKMDEFREQKKTILFVSHDMGAVKNYCNRVIWINDGQIIKEGNPKEVTKTYANFMHYGKLLTDATSEEKIEKKQMSAQSNNNVDNANFDFLWDDVNHCSQLGDGGAKIQRVSLYDLNSLTKTNLLEGGERVWFLIEVEIIDDIMLPIISVNINNETGNLLFGLNNSLMDITLPKMGNGTRVVFKFEFKMPLLRNGNYSMSVGFADGTYSNHVQKHIVHDAYIFKIASKELAARHYFITNEDIILKFESHPANR